MSDLGELLDGIRAFYLERFREAIEEHEADPGNEALVEPALRDATGEVVREGTLQLPCRGDLQVLRDGVCIAALTIDTERMLSFDPVEFTWEGRLQVELAPFQWNMCPLALAPAPALWLQLGWP